MKEFCKKIFDRIIFISALASIVLIILESDARIVNQYGFLINIVNNFIYILFTIDYLINIVSHKKIFNYIVSMGGLLDLAVLLPFYLPFLGLDLRFLRLFRLIRVLKIFRIPQYARSLKLFVNVFKKEKESLFISFSIACMLLVISSILVWFAEKDVQPDVFPNIMTAMWWSFATLTTVGYGDIYPITFLGRLIASITALIGIGIFAVPTGIISAGFVVEHQKEESKKQDE